MVRTTPFISHLAHLEGEYPYLGDLLTMVINHLLNGMILQVGNVQLTPTSMPPNKTSLKRKDALERPDALVRGGATKWAGLEA